VELFIAGIGPSEAELKEIALRHRLRDHIHWLGVVTHDKLPEFYAAADALVLPSHSEGTPTVLLETMAMGTPAIITRVGGVPDVVQHAENGLLFEPNESYARAFDR
jgi:glycosyltransferase involved in cell wall biosynthesis